MADARSVKTADKKVAQEIATAPVAMMILTVERKVADASPDLEDDEEWEDARSSFDWEVARSNGGTPPPEQK